MDDLEELADRGEGINFIPCVKWVRRGVAKSNPEKVKLNQEELSKIIEQTKSQLKDMENDGDDSDDADEKAKKNVGDPVDENGQRDIEKLYGLDTYDDDEEEAGNSVEAALGIGNLVSFANPRDDHYLTNPEIDDDASDIEDFVIKPTDNLILVGHVEGNAAILEVYVYNDVENALYIHHDLLLPSFPLALEWLNYEPGEKTASNLVAVGTMNPVIDVWDLDIVDGLEPVFSLGEKPTKKKKKDKKASWDNGHTDAVLALAWNRNVGHLMASGSVDETVLLWDLRKGRVATSLKGHGEKVQAIDWHPFESQMLLTGCCDEKTRVFDCSSEECKSWKVDGEVEKVVWNHFNPFTFFAATEKGMVHMIDVRQEKKPLWTLDAHSQGINGMSLSSQCPDCLITGSSDKMVKVWDIADNRPTCVVEHSASVGLIHALDGCPDAPFVVAFGGDKAANNFHVMDVREFAAVRNRFGQRTLSNPLGFSPFGYSTADEAEPETDEVNMEDEATDAIEAMSLAKIEESGGAAGKFRKKDKKKKKRKNNF